MKKLMELDFKKTNSRGKETFILPTGIKNKQN